MPRSNAYTVNILFSRDLSRILLVRKNRTAFKGLLNGPGGAVEAGEAPYACAMREILEETGLGQADFLPLDGDDGRLQPLGKLSVPYDCKTQDGAACELYYYAGVILEQSEGSVTPAAEALSWMPSDMVMLSRTDSDVFAGHGDLAYFAAAGYRAMLRFLPDGGPGPASVPDGRDAMAEAAARARGRLDKDFRQGDLYQASLDAAEISRLAYAAFCLRWKMPDMQKGGAGQDA